MSKDKELTTSARSSAEDMEAVNTLAKVMMDFCSRLIEKANVDRTVGGVITDTPDSSGKYLVQVMADEYRLYNGTNIDFQKGSAVWITMPSGSLRKMYISAKRGR